MFKLNISFQMPAFSPRVIINIHVSHIHSTLLKNGSDQVSEHVGQGPKCTVVSCGSSDLVLMYIFIHLSAVFCVRRLVC